MSTTSRASSAAGARDLRASIEARTAKIGIVGLGYVGLPLALLFSEAKFPVTGLDIDPEKIKALNNGKSYIYRIPESEIAAARGNNFAASDDYGHVAGLDVVLICVPTPLNEYREPDLSAIQATAKAIAPHLHAGQLIILESTTYPGTTQEVLAPILESGNPSGLTAARGGADSGNVFFVAFSPEREDPGNNTVARRDIPKVVGGLNPAASDLANALYGSIFNRTVPVSSPAVAEMTKLLENIYRCVNIALVNELKLLCLRMCIDIWEVIQAASTKTFGFHPFYPGPVLGGHCIPVYSFDLSWIANDIDLFTRFIELAGQINSAMPSYAIQRLSDALNGRGKPLSGSRL